MPERRSSRAKKTPKYSGFDDLSDDDFAETSPVPVKKQKVDNSSPSRKNEIRKDRNAAVGKTEADKGKKTRTPLSDKIYERELQQALEISLIQSQGSQEDNSGDDVVENTHVKKEYEEDDDFSPKAFNKKTGEDSDFSPKAFNKKTGEDSDFSPKAFNKKTGDDSDFSPKALSKKTSAPKKAAASSKTRGKETLLETVSNQDNKLCVIAEISGSSPPVCKSSPVKRSTMSVPPLSAQGAPPSCTSSWKPPAFAKSPGFKLSKDKSPSSGLRLGLSRNQRVKPLHSSVRVP